MIVEPAMVAVRWDEKLGGFYERVKSLMGDQKAVVTIASKMKIVWVMLVRREPHSNVNGKRYEKKLK